MFDDIKVWLRGAVKSATMWFNSIFAVVASVITELPSVLPELASVLPPDVYKYLLFLNILGNMALRVKTRLPLTAK